jgi:4-amino-4-deoxy-L-arabinose transferase-like glycosyltransferase
VRQQEEVPLLEGSHQPLLWWHILALGVVLAISAFFNFFALTRQDFFEYYYAAAIKSMLLSWHNFFFVSFDPAGFLALDKPPLGFWMQALSARLFGFSTFSILLPEALAGVLAVALVFHLVRRVFGPLAGLIAALVLAVSPISVVTNRNNIIDSLLVLTVLLAVWAVSKAVETGRFRWLCLCAILVGLGFNIKFLQAYMVVPAFGLVYVLGAPLRWRTKLGHLALALGVLLLVSLCWATIVDLTPAGQHPYVDSSPTNSELDLAFGFNGTFRLTADSSVVNNWAWEIGRPGMMRFFEQPVAGQSSWLLPLALLSLLALSWHRRWRLPLNRWQQALVLWGTWLLTMLVFFSNAHYFHLYYLSMLAPAIAALVGAGVVTLWQDYVRRGWRGWLLPSALLITGALQAYFLVPFPRWNSLLTTSIVGLCAMVGLVLVLARWRFPLHWQRVAVAITSLGLLSLLLAPTVWAAIPLSRAGRAFPVAGPPAPQTNVPPVLADPALVRYLLAHKGKAQYLLATMNTEAAAPFILDTGQAVMALGGYDGSSSFLSSDELIQQIDSGTVRFFLLPPSFYGDMIVISWVSTHCGAVPTDQWQSPSTASFEVDRLQLYDCAHHT